MKNIYAIRDRLADELVGHTMYLFMIFNTDQQAVRYFADAILDEKSILAKHPADYELLAIGELHEGRYIRSTDDQRVVITGDAIVSLSTPQLVKES